MAGDRFLNTQVIKLSFFTFRVDSYQAQVCKSKNQ